MGIRASGRWWPCLVLIAAAFAVHARTLSFGFTPLDDRLLIQDRVEWLADPSNLLAAFREGVFLGKEQNFYRPMLTLSLMLDTIVGGGSPFAYHLTNVLLHVVAVLLVFATLQRLDVKRELAFALAVLFAVHPVFTHAVAWLPGRNDTLLAIFILGGFLAFERWRESARSTWGLAFVVLFFLALLTKESAVVLAPLCALRMGLSGQRPRSTALVAGGTVLAGVAWYWLRSTYGGTQSPPRFDVAALREFFAALVVLYGKWIAPVSQSVVPTTADSSLIPGLIALALSSAIAWRAGFRDARVALFGTAWFVAFLFLPTLAGSLGVVMPIHHEHRLYLPAVGFLAAVAQLRFERLFAVPRVVIAGLVLLFAGMTVVRSGVYATPLAFAEDAVRSSPSLAVSWKMRADAWLEEKQLDRSIADSERALALRPGYAGALSNLGKAHSEAGRPDRAIEYYTRAIAAEPNDLEHRNNRAVVLLGSDDPSRALEDLDFVLARDPRNWKALNNRGRAMIYAKRYEEAVADLSVAIEARPDDGEAYHNRAVAYFYRKEYARAWSDVAAAQARNIPVTPAFLDALRSASPRAQ